MNPFIAAFLFGITGYLCGSLPFALWVTRWRKGVDVRLAGSGHMTATNTMRQAGWFAGAAVLVLDLAKGFLPTFLAIHFGAAAWVVFMTAGSTIVGHCWPVFAEFHGGMGLAASGGALLAVSPLGFLLGLGILIFLVLVIHHSARASVITGALISPLLWILGLRGTVIWVAAAVGFVIALRFLIDWNRHYRELWLDRG